MPPATVTERPTPGGRPARGSGSGSDASRAPSSTASCRAQTYDKADIPLARWFPSDGPTGPAGLALITCADYRDGEWRANTVVEAVPA